MPGAGCLKKLGQSRRALVESGKSAPWKVALAVALRQRTTATNRWLSTHLHSGNLYEVSRKVNAWLRVPDDVLTRKLGLTPSPRDDPFWASG